MVSPVSQNDSVQFGWPSSVNIELLQIQCKPFENKNKKFNTSHTSIIIIKKTSWTPKTWLMYTPLLLSLTEPFLWESLQTWAIYNHIKKLTQWKEESIHSPGLQQKSCIWWDRKAVNFRQMLNKNEADKTDRCCCQLKAFHKPFNRKGAIHLHNNANSHIELNESIRKILCH